MQSVLGRYRLSMSSRGGRRAYGDTVGLGVGVVGMVLTVLLLLWLVRRLTRENAPATEAPEEGVEGEMGYSLKSMMSLQKVQKWFYHGGRPIGWHVFSTVYRPRSPHSGSLRITWSPLRCRAGDPVGSSVSRSSWLSLQASASSYPCSERK